MTDKHKYMDIMNTSLGNVLSKIDDPDVWDKIMDRINNAFIEKDRDIMNNSDVNYVNIGLKSNKNISINIDPSNLIMLPLRDFKIASAYVDNPNDFKIGHNLKICAIQYNGEIIPKDICINPDNGSFVDCMFEDDMILGYVDFVRNTINISSLNRHITGIYVSGELLYDASPWTILKMYNSEVRSDWNEPVLTVKVNIGLGEAYKDKFIKEIKHIYEIYSKSGFVFDFIFFDNDLLVHRCNRVTLDQFGKKVLDYIDKYILDIKAIHAISISEDPDTV